MAERLGIADPGAPMVTAIDLATAPGATGMIVFLQGVTGTERARWQHFIVDYARAVLPRILLEIAPRDTRLARGVRGGLDK